MTEGYLRSSFWGHMYACTTPFCTTPWRPDAGSVSTYLHDDIIQYGRAAVPRQRACDIMHNMFAECKTIFLQTI